MKSPALPLLTPGPARQQALALVFLAGAIIGVLGGMIGLGGAEFRLPLLIGVFGFAALQAIIMNKAMSLIVVITALPARLISVPLAELSPTGSSSRTSWPEASSAPGSEPTGPPGSSPKRSTASSRSCSS